MDRWAELFKHARRRHGVLTVADARDCGIPERTLRDRARAEGWECLHRGVWALPGSQDTPLRDCAAAVAAGGAHAAVGRRSAGWLWGLRPQAPARAEIVLPGRAPAVRRPGLVALRSTSLVPADTTAHAGLPVTTPARTLGDLAAVTSTDRLLELVVRAMQRELLGLADLAAQVGAMRGAPGIGRLREAVRLLEKDRVDSLLEREVRREIARRGLPRPLSEPLWLFGRRAQIDIAWPELKAGVEVDGFAHHHRSEDLARDHHKSNLLAGEGWVLLRVGYLRWTRDRDGFMRELQRVLANLSLDSGEYSPKVSESRGGD